MSNIERIQVDCSGRTAEVEVAGEGPDVVIIGTAAPMALTRPAALTIADSGFRVVNFDYGSDAHEPEPRTALAQVDDVADVMTALGVDACVAIGVSRGAMTAFGLAASRPDLVRRLVLVAPVAGWSDVIGVVDPVSDPEPGAGPDAILRQVFSDEYLATSRDEALALMMSTPGTVDRVGREDEETFDAGLRVTCPTLVVVGGGDQVVSAAHPERYLAEIEGSVRLDAPEASHAWIMEDPSGFASLIGPFVRG